MAGWPWDAELLAGLDPAAWVVALEFDEFELDDAEFEELALEEFDEFDGAFPCTACGWEAGAELPLPEPFADGVPTLCRTLEKFCDGALADAELAGAGGAELGAIILSRIASVMN